MQQHGEIQPRIDEGIDRKTLNTLRKRFMAVNATRLRRVLQALPSRQYNVLQLLPLLQGHLVLPVAATARRWRRAPPLPPRSSRPHPCHSPLHPLLRSSPPSRCCAWWGN